MAAAGFYREDLNRIPLVLGVSQFIRVVSFSCLDVVIEIPGNSFLLISYA